jgi:hypothetical protein
VGKLWPGLVTWVRESMLSFDTPLISPEDVNIPVCVSNADEAIAIVREHYSQWAKTHEGPDRAQIAQTS